MAAVTLGALVHDHGAATENALHVVAHYLRANRPWLTLYGLRLRSSSLPPCLATELGPIQKIVPDELMLMIFGWLTPFTLGAASCVCRQWRILAEHPLLWRRACMDAFRGGCNHDENLRLLCLYYNGSWKRMFLERSHVRFDGVYVARNTYIRTGSAQWRDRRSDPPVHLVAYFRYLRFLPNGTVYYRTTPEIPAKVGRALEKAGHPRTKGPGFARGFDVLKGRYRVSGDVVSCVAVYPNSRSTEFRLRVRIRSTCRGANNRLDPFSIVTTDRQGGWEYGLAEDAADPEVEYLQGAETRREHKRGMAPFVFIPWEQVDYCAFNSAPDKMDFFVSS